MKVKNLLLAGVAVAVLAGGYALFARDDKAGEMAATAPAAGEEGPAGGGAPQGMPVEAVPVAQTGIEKTIDAVGTLQSNESVIVKPEIAGLVTEIGFEEGSVVTKDAVLIKLDSSVYAAEVAQAQASYTLTQTNYKRAQELFEKKTGSERARDEAKSKMGVDKATLDLAQAQLRKATIKAPFDGVIGLRNVSVGDYVTVGEALVNIEDIDPLKVDFRIAETNLGNVAVGQKVRINVDALPGKIFEGEVYAINPRIDEQGRSIVIRARIDNVDGALKPGLFARVSLIVETKGNALTVPEEALLPEGDKHFVYTVVDGKVANVEVKVGQRRKGQVEILSGLKAGDQVVTAGQMKVQPGMPVTVMPAGGPPQGAPAPEAPAAEAPATEEGAQ